MKSIVVVALSASLWLAACGGEQAEPGRLGPLDMTMVRRMCSGQPVEPRTTDAERAAEILAGGLRLREHPAQPLADDPTWDEDPLSDDNWKFQYHSLDWLDQLRRTSRATGDEAMRERYRFLLRDWVRDNPYTHPLPPPTSPPSDYAWFDMGVGWRALVLICAVDELGKEPWLVEALNDHANALADPVQYAGAGNHAMHQNNGLLALACIGDHAVWRAHAEGRNQTLLDSAVDSDGVSHEGSFGYQRLNHTWWSEAQERLIACNLKPKGPWARIERMPQVMAHMTAPDGRPALIGDTIYAPFFENVSPEVAWAVTRGATGSPPAETVVVYESAGYIIGRSGWGTERPIDEESFWTLRFGPPLDATVHGHEDHGSITFAAYGARLLWDQGLYAYYGGAPRAYMIRNDAHNSIDIEGAKYYLGAKAPLLHEQHGNGWDFFIVDIKALRHTTWSRAMFASRSSHYLIVRDRTTQADGGDVLQRWHLGEGRQTSFDGRRLDTSGDGANVSIIWPFVKPSVEVIEGRQSPMLGWRSLLYRELIPIPVVEARVSGIVVDLYTVIVPRRDGDAPSSVDVISAEQQSDGHHITVRIGSQCETVRIGEDSADVVSALTPCP